MLCPHKNQIKKPFNFGVWEQMVLLMKARSRKPIYMPSQNANYNEMCNNVSNVRIDDLRMIRSAYSEPNLNRTTGVGMSNNLSRKDSSTSLIEKKPFSRPFIKSRLGTSATRMASVSPSTSPTSETRILLRQNQELRHRLQEETCNYRRRLETYKTAQQNQAALVGRLQSKVLQYKQRCNDLEGKVHETLPYGISSTTGPTCTAAISLPPAQTGSYHHSAPISLPCGSTLDQPQLLRDCCDDQEDICKRLENEKQRCEQLLTHNNMLRQQLEESHRTNEALTNDLQKLTTDWEHLRDELLTKEDEWKEEEQAFNDYYNSEHNRLINMWKDVTAVKRMFRDMELHMKADMNRMRNDMTSANREAINACTNVSLNIRHAFRTEEANKSFTDRTNTDLHAQISALRVQNDAGRNEILQQEQRIKDMMNDLKLLEDRCNEAESQCVQVNRLNDEIERLNIALRDIANIVVMDAESVGVDSEPAAQHLHLSQSGLGAPRSPKRGGLRTSQAFAEGTISAVQATLNKYRLTVHDFQVRLQSNEDSLNSTRAQLDKSEHSREILTTKITELTDKMDSSNIELLELRKDRDSLQKTLDNLRTDKQLIERDKSELNSMVECLNNDCEKLQNSNSRLQKTLDALDEEKKFLELELQRIMKDKELTEMSLRAEEDRGSRMREEMIMLREDLNKLYLTRDLLEQQRLESDTMQSLLEKQKSELEYELDKILIERNEIHNLLENTSSSNDNINTEVKQLQTTVTELEMERTKLLNQSTDQTNDIASLKKELVAAEQLRLDMDTEKLALSEKLKCLEIEKDKVEQELSQVARERNDLCNQVTAVTRKKEHINEDLMRTRQRLEQANEMNNRINRNLEELVKENEEKQVIIEGYEKDMQRLQEQQASLRSEKESLEAVLFDTNTTLETTETRKLQLEREVQDLLINKENMKSNIQRLTKDLETSERRAQDMKIHLTNAAANLEAEYQQKINNLKSFGEENVKKLNDERENLRQALEKRMQQALSALEQTKTAELTSLQERYESLQLQLDSVCQQHEEVIIRAENDKQQALLLAHRDKQSVIDKLEQVMRELNTENDNLERLRREAGARSEKDRSVIAQLKDDIAKMKTKMDEQKVRYDEENNKLQLYSASIREEKDAAQLEVDGLKVQVRLAEDKGDAINIQLQDTIRKLKETENQMEMVRKELTDTRRQLADSNIEREKYSNTNKELRDHIKRVEAQRREQNRNIEEAVQKISSLEETRNTLDSEKNRLTTVLKETKNSLNKTTSELQTSNQSIQKMSQNAGQKDALEKELQARLTNETEERERVQQELNQVKKQMSDLDANLCATRQELARARCKANQDEHRFHAKEQELIGRLEEGRCREKRLEDQKHNLEVCLADATQQIQELKARLGGAEGRVRALDEQLAVTEQAKKEVEHKLGSIAHTLRRIAGIQMDGSVTLPYRLLSPTRRYSPARGGHDYDVRSAAGDCTLVDVDPELVRKGVRTLMQQVAQVEREKDDYKAQLCSAKKQLNDAIEQQAKSDNKLSKMQQNLRSVQETKVNLEAKLAQKITNLQSVEESLKQKTDESNHLRDKVNSLELQLSNCGDEKGQFEDRLEKCRQNGARLESDKRHLQEELARCESRASKLDLQRVALEGDIQRLQMALQEKDGNLKSVQERLETQSRSASQLEDRCIALKSTVDQLKERLQAAAINETELRAEINCLQKERSEQGHHVLAGQDKVKQIQKSMATSENERRILSERLDAAQNCIADLRRSQQSQQDVIQRLQEQSADMEVQKSSLESQLRIAKWNQDQGDQISPGIGGQDDDLSRQILNLQRERSELRGKLDSLQEKCRQLETDKRSKFATTGQAYDRSEKSTYGGRGDGEYDTNRMETESYITRGGGHRSLNGTPGVSFSCGIDHSAIEQENRDLRLKVRRLETLLAEKESELARAKTKLFESPKCVPSGDPDRYRSAQMQAERMLDAREQSHRQQVLRLENQISMLREQLAQEAKRRQQYILRSSRAGREMHQLRQTLGDSLRHVSQEPLDAGLLESESRRLDSAVSMSLPPASIGHESISPRYK